MDDFFPQLRETPALIFVNPAAGRGRAGKRLAEIRQLFGARGIPAEFLLTSSAHDLESRAYGAIADGRRLLFAMGGDGTFQVLVNAAHGSDVLLGLLPAGGGNDFATAIGLPHDPVAAARSLLDGTPRFVDVLRPRTDDGNSRLFVGGGGVGLDVEASQYAANAYRHLPGRLRYLVSAVRALAKFKPPRVRVEFPGSTSLALEGPSLLAATFNTPSYGAGVRLAPGARLDDGLLDAVLVANLSALQIGTALPRLMLRGILPEAYIQRARATRVVLWSDRPCLFHGDGEIFGSTPVEIEVVPRAIRTLTPKAR